MKIFLLAIFINNIFFGMEHCRNKDLNTTPDVDLYEANKGTIEKLFAQMLNFCKDTTIKKLQNSQIVDKNIKVFPATEENEKIRMEVLLSHVGVYYSSTYIHKKNDFNESIAKIIPTIEKNIAQMGAQFLPGQYQAFLDKLLSKWETEFTINTLQKKSKALSPLILDCYLSTYTKVMDFYYKDKIFNVAVLKEINTIKKLFADFKNNIIFEEQFIKYMCKLNKDNKLNQYKILNEVHTRFSENNVLNEKALLQLTTLEKEKSDLKNEIQKILAKNENTLKMEIISDLKNKSTSTIDNEIKIKCARKKAANYYIKKIICIFQNLLLSKSNDSLLQAEKHTPTKEKTKELLFNIKICENVIKKANLTQPEIVTIIGILIDIFYKPKKKKRDFLKLKLAYLSNEIPFNDNNIFLTKKHIEKLEEDITYLKEKKASMASFFDKEIMMQEPYQKHVGFIEAWNILKSYPKIRKFLLNSFQWVHDSEERDKEVINHINYLNKNIALGTQSLTEICGESFLLLLKKETYIALNRFNTTIDFLTYYILSEKLDNLYDISYNLLSFKRLEKKIPSEKIMPKIAYALIGILKIVNSKDRIEGFFEKLKKFKHLDSEEINNIAAYVLNVKKEFKLEEKEITKK